MSSRAEYELWHQRMGHAGERVMQNLHKCVDGVPNLSSNKHSFHKCECCMRGKVKAAPKRKTTHVTTTARGQMFHMDFGFVRGSSFQSTNEKGKIVTSRDGYNSYLIIVDSYTATLGFIYSRLNILHSTLSSNFWTDLELKTAHFGKSAVTRAVNWPRVVNFVK